MSDLVSSLPGRAIIDIAKNAACGRQPLTAMGRARDGRAIVSNPIDIDVERSDMPTSIADINKLSRLTLTERGAQIPITTVATFGDGVVLDVRESSRMTYTSSNPRAAAVSEFGMITAMGVGEATIRADTGTAARAA